ncbi:MULTISPECIES: peptidylprolyl isomerase [Acidianus]|uniref:peptidylprolyl isomerase n=1 Tax=Candidatus Acidianus copahuensis TaxID=1160895 RepID=A0A031LNQ8_9CREN|nr:MULTISPECIES: peptidylprolyl isomerase [Acidianus]EZQ04764.1 peptidylprolyl isomerase [Candidatus Acidianus copahuensis]NON61788.1 peptidylprolyl isomerase [Acidianus sp. RZ1]
MFKDNDFIYIDYVAKIKDTGEVIDTTIEEEAKKANVYNTEQKYKPLLVILGEHRVIPGLEEALYNLNENEEKEFEIQPEKAYGNRDPSKVKIVSLSELKRQGINPRPNMIVRVEGGGYATIRSVTGGRVVLDLNHPYAGRTLMYKVKVVKVLKEPKEKVDALIERWFKENKLNTEILQDSKNVKITIPKDYFLVDGIEIVKYNLARDILTYVLPGFTLTYTEVFNEDTFKR